MTLRLWIEINHQAPYRTGGWSWLCEHGEGLTGAAGGAREIEAEAFGVAALQAALADLPEGAAVALHLSDARLIEGVRTMSARRTAGWVNASGDLDPEAKSWEVIAKALTGRALSLVRTQPADSRTPAGFAAAWAELARDKAKTKGTFKSAIPRPNLAKIRGL
ncbi:MAG: ribonuclease H [Phenylobacterium sp.]|uniref:ribonuclease H n=1 Tax=Phenylobacterium sp. TaxID=1871053 RepID=UPI0025E72F08|nr:ribonuclease H [Phenylobacterium sp.]MCG9917613.1 ribonuclease H [Phenylobacterium sp.]